MEGTMNLPANKEETQYPSAASKADFPLVAGKLQPRNFDDLYRLSKLLSVSKLTPKDASSPEQVFVALAHGLELGLSCMQSMQSIGVINGRPSIFGDALPALVESRVPGQLWVHEEWFDGKGDQFAAHCKTIRRFIDDRPNRVREHSFSVADAKEAGLYGKSVWKAYPRRMLMWRARSYSFRDNFPDVTQGLLTFEEVQTLPPEHPTVTEIFEVKRQEQPKPEAPVIEEVDEAHEVPPESTTTPEPTPEPTPPAEGPEFEQRRRTHSFVITLPDVDELIEIKTAGLSEETYHSLSAIRHLLPGELVDEITNGYLDSLPIRHKSIEWLREDEGKELLGMLRNVSDDPPPAGVNESALPEDDPRFGPAPEETPPADDAAARHEAAKSLFD